MDDKQDIDLVVKYLPVMIINYKEETITKCLTTTKVSLGKPISPPGTMPEGDTSLCVIPAEVHDLNLVMGRHETNPN